MEESDIGAVIYSYSDAEAVRDGVLVVFDLRGSHRDRVTRAVWHHYTCELFPGLVDVTRLTALWDAVRATTPDEDGWRTSYLDAERRSLWMLPNEVGGFTLMFPEDY